MFEFIRGTVDSKTTATAVLDASGVGYLLDIPLSTYEQLPEDGQEARLLVHYYVREDTQRLYGFASETERDLFRLLIGVSKIGPKVGLSILSSMPVEDLVRCISTGDAARFKSVPGVGPTTAQRLVVELKKKVMPIAAAIITADKASDSYAPSTSKTTTSEDAYAALVSLGYSESQVRKALSRVGETVDEEAPVEEWIKRALKVM